VSEDYDELDPEARDRKRHAARLIEALDADAQLAHFRDLLQDERVRDLMWRLLVECGIYKSTYQKNFGDMALMEGRRQMGLWLLNEICAADPNAEMLMRRKAVEVAFAQAQTERSTRQRPKPRT
jgi:hypothetical protein